MYYRAKHVVDIKLRLIFRSFFLIKTKNYKSSSTETDNDGSRGLKGATMTDNRGKDGQIYHAKLSICNYFYYSSENVLEGCFYCIT